MITSVLYIVFLRAYKSSLVISHSSLVTRHLSLVIRHLSLVIRHLSLVIRHYLSIFFMVKALRTR